VSDTERLRVAFLTHAYPRHDGDVAGAFLERVALGLIARGTAVHVIAPGDEGRGGAERRHQVPITRIRYAPARCEVLAYRGTMLAALRSPSGLLWFSTLLLRQARVVRRLWKRGEINLVHAHWWVPGGLSAWLSGAPYVVTMHGMDVVLLESSAAARALGRRVLRAAAAVTAVSSDLAGRASRVAGVDRQRIIVQPMPIDAKQFGRTSKGGGGIVTVGRLMPRKRIDLLLQALARLRAAGRGVSLKIVGDGPERPRLERCVADLALGAAVRFTGEVRPERVPEEIGDADVFAFPALGEGFGLAAAEALLLGVPVVGSTDGGGVTDIVPPQGGGRVVNPEVGELTRAIGELLDDPDARRHAAEAGAALRRRLEPDAVARRFQMLYREVVQSRAARAAARRRSAEAE
jgi:glycosyltransferase involved in cell wall biosynthesis